MKLGAWGCYLIVINAIGFVAAVLGRRPRPNAAQGGNAVRILIALSGGALGLLLAMLLFERKAQKDTMLSWVVTVCALTIQLVLLLLFKGRHAEPLNFAFWSFFAQHKLLTAYLTFINIITFAVFALDKRRAVKHGTRIRIVTLLLLAFIGGSLGGLLAMYLFRHKTNKSYFTVGMPAILLTQLVVLLYAMNVG